MFDRLCTVCVLLGFALIGLTTFSPWLLVAGLLLICVPAMAWM